VNRPLDSRGPVTRVSNVTDPTLTVYKPASANGTAMLVFPGGAYKWLSMDIEGSEVCDYFGRAGITCVIVKYRVPQPDAARYQQPLQDAQRALGLVRLHAKEWGIDPEKVGVIGFSAGGHLSAAISNNFKERSYKKVDAADEQSCRPNFAVVLYPGYLAAGKDDGTVSAEVMPSSETSPTFLFQTEDDSARVENSLAYYWALKKAKVLAEMHIYSEGGHGYGLRPKINPVTEVWPKLALKWLESIKMLSASSGSGQ
jgi:acetyl esterase/lipase